VTAAAWNPDETGEQVRALIRTELAQVLESGHHVTATDLLVKAPRSLAACRPPGILQDARSFAKRLALALARHELDIDRHRAIVLVTSVLRRFVDRVSATAEN
jgi:hypothetical protein